MEGKGKKGIYIYSKKVLLWGVVVKKQVYIVYVSINQFDCLSPERKNLGRGRKGDGTFLDHI